MVTTKDILALYWKAAWRYKGGVIATLIFLPLAMLANSYLPALVATHVLERLSSGDFTPNDIWGSFGRDILLFAGLAISGAVILWRLVGYSIWTLEIKVQQDLHDRMFKHLLTLDTNFHSNRFGGALVSQASKFASAYIRVQDTVVFEFVPLALSLAFTSIILWPRMPQFVLVLWGISAIFIVSTIFISRAVRKYNEAEAEASNKITARLADAVANIAAIKSFSASKSERGSYNHTTARWADAERAIMRSTLLRQTWYSSVTVTLAISSLILSVVAVVVFHADVSNVFLAYTYSNIIGQGLWEFSSQAMRTWTHALGDAKAMAEVLQVTPAVADPAKPASVQIKQGDIAFTDVSFTHADTKAGDTLFKDFNLRIAAGQKIGLVGHSGSGKTTLTRLLLRFSDIQKGAITIDGQDIASISQDDLRRHIAYVPQEPLLFHRSLRENIAYGKPDATDAEIREAARKAHAAEFIDKLPDSYNTIVGERGVKLSGGQRQRIAIARAILKDAPILVLDEATSALDSESERLIQAALWELMKGRTAIVIAHRLSTIQRMDAIVVLENGTIREQGTHAELLKKKNGVYAELWAHQSGGFIEE